MGSLAEALKKAETDTAATAPPEEERALTTDEITADKTLPPAEASEILPTTDPEPPTTEAAVTNQVAEASAELDDIISSIETELTDGADEIANPPEAVAKPTTTGPPPTPTRETEVPVPTSKTEAPEPESTGDVPLDEALPDAESLIAVPTHFGPTHVATPKSADVSPMPTEAAPPTAASIEPPETFSSPEPVWDLDTDQEITEQYRTIRRRLMARLGRERNQAVAIVGVVNPKGSNANESASTVAALNLATVLAEVKGTAAAVIDFNPTDRRLTDLLGLDNATGLADLLRGHASIDDVVHAGLVGYLDIIAAGNLNAQGSDDLFVNDQAVSSLRDLRDRYDFVIADAGANPSAEQIDAVAKLFTGVVLITDTAAKKKAKQLVDRLHAKRVNVLGCILTADAA
jgi:Mrp family chromosome partitioning ATPase